MKKFLLCSVFAFVATGCATATLIETEPGKRVVVSESPQGNPEARQKAIAIATQECNGKKPVIVKQGRVVTGSSTSGQEETTPQKNTMFNPFTGKSKTTSSSRTSSSSTTSNTYEWQLVFECQ